MSILSKKVGVSILRTARYDLVKDIELHLKCDPEPKALYIEKGVQLSPKSGHLPAIGALYLIKDFELLLCNTQEEALQIAKSFKDDCIAILRTKQARLSDLEECVDDVAS